MFGTFYYRDYPHGKRHKNSGVKLVHVSTINNYFIKTKLVN